MNKRNTMQCYNSLFKLLSRHPSQPSPIPVHPFLLTPVSTQLKFLHTFTHPLPPYPEICSSFHLTWWRRQSSESGGGSVPDLDVNKEVDLINLKFADAREEIEMAMDSKETVYFNEEAECARAAVKEVLDLFHGLLGKLPESQKAALLRSMELKIQQLEAELRQLDE